MLRAGVRFFQKPARSAVDGADFVVECQRQIALDSGHRRAHFVAGRADKFAALLFGDSLFADVAHHGHGSDKVGRAGRNDRRHHQRNNLLLPFAALELQCLADALLFAQRYFKRVGVWLKILAIFLQQRHHQLHIDAGGFVDWPLGHQRCRRVDEADLALGIGHDHTVGD